MAGLVYVTSFQLDVDDSLMSSIGGWAPDWWLFDHDAGTMSVDRPVAAFFHDVDDETARWATARMRPQSIASFEQPLTRAAWRAVPSAYVVTADDAAIPAELQRDMAKRSDRVHELPGSHSPFLSRPGDLADILRDELRAATG